MEAFYEFMRSTWTVWLMATFLGIVVWAFWPRGKEKFERYGEIPFRDDEQANGRE